MSDPIIGRRADLQALGRFVEALPDGGQALLIEGDAGIGKTAMWSEGLRAARERGFGVLFARSADAETRIAFATVGDLFTPVLGETLPSLVPVHAAHSKSTMLLREPDGSPPETRVLGLALVSVVRALAQEKPLLVALDDVQWIDSSSAEILRFALRRLDGQPVGVLATVRGRPVKAPLELDRAFAAFGRLPLEPLSIGAVHRLLWGRLSLNLPRPALMRVQEATGGNPFYALELGRALVDGTIRAGTGPIALPKSLQSVVGNRLDRLPARVRETLVAVAALAVPTVTLLEPFAVSAVDDIDRARAEVCWSWTATGSASPILLWRRPAIPECRTTGDAASIVVSPIWTSISRNARAISPSRLPVPTRRSLRRSMRERRTPMHAGPSWPQPSSPNWQRCWLRREPSMT